MPARAAGGFARAVALSRDERSEIAREAAKARWARNLPHATHEGVVRLGDVEIEVMVLNNGQRVVTQSGLLTALGCDQRSKGRQSHRSIAKLPAFLGVQNLKPFISRELIVTASRIEFRTAQGMKAFGYVANFLPEVCDMFARAQLAGVLKVPQRCMADRAKTVAEQLRRFGTIRLIDEATGFQNVREE
ncbi:hypothetical protein [Bradyrhizobium sp. 1(2017)]|uniref:hypothetical protein n=1 Tax=Bradyrhizobium sp. 1(2017) TaxID=1404888 RepID=UPI00140ECAF4|nr:hypothetical protein [Bradyrhizobium sp. 1(2017)]QIO32732.1 hypothetical protein HAP40_13440 [Bradyrhizobium sp. 1(2017)]